MHDDDPLTAALNRARPAALDPDRLADTPRATAELEAILSGTYTTPDALAGTSASAEHFALPRHSPAAHFPALPQRGLAARFPALRLPPLHLPGRSRHPARRFRRQPRALAARTARHAPGFGRLRRVTAPLAAALAVIMVAVIARTVVLPHPAAKPPGPGTGTASGAAAAGHSASAMLLQIASTVEHQDTAGSPDNYWREETATGWLAIAGGGTDSYLIRSTDHVTVSLGVRPGEQSYQVSGQDALTAPASSRDTTRWQAAGSPATLQVALAIAAKEPASTPGSAATADTAAADPGATGTPLPPEAGGKTLTLGPGKPSVDHINSGDAIVAIGDENVTYAGLVYLPTDPTGLYSYLDKLYTQAHEDGDPDASDEPSWMFEQVENLLTMPISPAVRAAVYRVLAAVPGIEDYGPATDALGRSGTALALPTLYSTTFGTVRDELIVAPQTASLLATEEVIVEPSAAARLAGIEPGTAIDYSAVTGLAWAEQQIPLPHDAGSN